MSEGELCRLTKESGQFNLTEFTRLASARCYELLQLVFYPSLRCEYDVENGFLLKNEFHSDPNSEKHMLNLSDESDVKILERTLKPIIFKRWRECHDSAVKCCKSVMKKPTGSKKCHSIWDGWSCHSSTEFGDSSKPKCPDYMYPSTCNKIKGI